MSVNQIILSRHLEIDWDIQKGQKIIIQSTAGPVVVVSSGISMGNAQIGELLRLKISIVGNLLKELLFPKKKLRF